MDRKLKRPWTRGMRTPWSSWKRLLNSSTVSSLRSKITTKLLRKSFLVSTMAQTNSTLRRWTLMTLRWVKRQRRRTRQRLIAKNLSISLVRFVTSGQSVKRKRESAKHSKLSWTRRRPSSAKSWTPSTRRLNSCRLITVVWLHVATWSALAKVKREASAERRDDLGFCPRVVTVVYLEALHNCNFKTYLFMQRFVFLSHIFFRTS